MSTPRPERKTTPPGIGAGAPTASSPGMGYGAGTRSTNPDLQNRIKIIEELFINSTQLQLESDVVPRSDYEKLEQITGVLLHTLNNRQDNLPPNPGRVIPEDSFTFISTLREKLEKHKLNLSAAIENHRIMHKPGIAFESRQLKICENLLKDVVALQGQLDHVIGAPPAYVGSGSSYRDTTARLSASHITKLESDADVAEEQAAKMRAQLEARKRAAAAEAAAANAEAEAAKMRKMLEERRKKHGAGADVQRPKGPGHR